MLTKEEYRARQTAQQSKYKNKFFERWFSWWRNPTDRFAGLVSVFTALLFFATVGLWLATASLVDDARSAGRAWIGPTDAKMLLFAAGQPLKMVVQYGNSGKQPAEATDLLAVHTFTEAEWNNGQAGDFIIKAADSCMKIGTLGYPIHIAYPTTGFSSFQLTYDASLKEMPESKKIIVSDAIIKGDKKITILGCFVYHTIEHIRHSAFCYYYSPGADQSHLPYCNVGQAAD